MKPSPKFWDRIARKYAKSPVGNPEAYAHKLKQTQERLRSDMKLVEFGCGTGTTAFLHAPFVKEILATDISGEMLDIARDKAADQRVENVRFEQTTIEDFAADAESFDVVLALSLLHLLGDPAAAIRKSFELLKPGGIFVSSTVCIGDMNPLLGYLLPVGRFLRLAPYVNVFGRDWLVPAIENAGFTIDYEFRPGPTDAVFIIARKG